jgi:hypothetical protein
MQIARDPRIHVSTVGDNGVIVIAQKETVRIGTPVHSGRMAFVRNTYPAVYNHVVRNMNSLIEQTKEKQKRSMRGGHFFLYRYMVLLAFLLCFSFGIASIYVKACAAVSFTVSILHIFLSIYNIVIYLLNRPLIHRDLAIHLSSGDMPDSNKKNMFYTAPIETSVLTGGLGAFVDPTRIIAAVQLENKHVTSIQVMFYTDVYKRDARFPRECAFYLILFIIMFILAIIFVSISPSH